MFQMKRKMTPRHKDAQGWDWSHIIVWHFAMSMCPAWILVADGGRSSLPGIIRLGCAFCLCNFLDMWLWRNLFHFCKSSFHHLWNEKYSARPLRCFYFSHSAKLGEMPSNLIKPIILSVFKKNEWGQPVNIKIFSSTETLQTLWSLTALGLLIFHLLCWISPICSSDQLSIVLHPGRLSCKDYNTGSCPLTSRWVQPLGRRLKGGQSVRFCPLHSPCLWEVAVN